MIIAFLDDPKEVIWLAYGAGMIEQHREMAEQKKRQNEASRPIIFRRKV